MKFNRLGNTGLAVSDLALGAMLFGGEEASNTPKEESIRMVHRYLDAGGNHIDTADVYTDGRSEDIVGEALVGKRDRVVLATKVRFGGGDVNNVGLSRRHIMNAVETSLRKLRTDYIDLYYMHSWDPLTPIEESLRAFDDLVTAGKVRYIGVSNFKAWQVMKALSVSDAHGWARFVAAQYQYSLIIRDIEYEYLDLFASEGVGIVPWGPLGGGFLSGKYQRAQRPTEGRISTSPAHDEENWQRRNTDRNWDIIDAVGKIAEARGATYPQIALAWLRAQPNVSSVIIGARTLDQLDDNLAAAEIDLTPDERNALADASQLPELYPYRFLQVYGQRTLNT